MRGIQRWSLIHQSSHFPTFKIQTHNLCTGLQGLLPSPTMPSLTNLQPHGSSLASQSTPSWFLSQDLTTHLLPGTLCPELCAAPEPLRSLPKCPLSDSPAPDHPINSPDTGLFPSCIYHIWNVQPISGFLVCCWTLASVGRSLHRADGGFVSPGLVSPS